MIQPKQVFTFPISKAVVMADCKIVDDGDAFEFGEPNEDYQFGAFADSMTLASKDGKEYVFAVAVWDWKGRLIYSPVPAEKREDDADD